MTTSDTPTSGPRFDTGHDDANRAAVTAVAAADPGLVGIGPRGPRDAVDRIVKGARLHD